MSARSREPLNQRHRFTPVLSQKSPSANFLLRRPKTRGSQTRIPHPRQCLSFKRLELTQAPLAPVGNCKRPSKGVEFIPEDDLKGPGVRLKESTRTKPERKRKASG